METKSCPMCAESIKAEALKCRYCGSRVDRTERRESALMAERDWHRGDPDRKLAGVCTALARNLDLPVMAVRAGFMFLVLFRGFGLFVYGVLWLMLPAEPGEKAPFEKVLAWAKSFIEAPPRRNDHAETEEDLKTDWR